jgi:hypothetical protein
MRQRSDLDSVVETILVDAYGDDEQYVAFLTVIEEETRLPAAATLLGAPVTVTGLDYTNEARGLVAICEGSNGTGEVALADLAFPPDTVTAWIHAAYRHYLGLQPFPVRPRPDWTWPDRAESLPAGVGRKPLTDRAYLGSRHPREVGGLGRT